MNLLATVLKRWAFSFEAVKKNSLVDEVKWFSALTTTTSISSWQAKRAVVLTESRLS
jgi:hypothetical protein